MKKELKFNRDTNISDKIVSELENIWNIRFPDKYLQITAQHDGSKIKILGDNGEWKEGIISIPGWRGKYAVVEFLGYANAVAVTSTGVFIAYNAYKECLPEPNRILPFAIDGGGNLFFFDYRKNAKEPAIVFLDHERAITEEDLSAEDLEKKPLKEWQESNLYPVCNSFSEFLDLISTVDN